MALSTEERVQIRNLKDEGWDPETTIFVMVLSQLTKIPIPGVAGLWANASGDYYEMFPWEDTDDEVDPGGS